MDYKVIVDAGHGGSDPGAIGNNLKEKDLNLRAALYINKRLKELGINSVLTRDSDISLPKNDRIRKIRNLIDNPQSTILVSNHINAGGGEGAEIVYSLNSLPTLAKLVLDNIGGAGQKTRKIYQRRLPENPNLDYYYILRESGVADTILIEYGFIDNINDSTRLNQNIEKYAEAVVRAIAEYLGVTYSDKPSEVVDDFYIVQKGDTLYSISKKHGISVSELKEINNLSSDLLTIGQKLYFKPRDYTTYIVEKGDSLWKIAGKYNITVQDLIDLNKLDSLTIQIGQELVVPGVDIEIDENKYIVQSGDTLWKIAKQYNVSVDDLKLANNLSSNLLSIGQELIIP